MIKLSKLPHLFWMLLIALFFSCEEQANAPMADSALYPAELQFGEYPVGLQTLWLFDETRKAVPYANWNGQLFPSTESTGRQFQVNIWYPSSATSNSKRVSLDHYLELFYRQVSFKPSQELSSFGKSELKSKLVSLGGLDSISDDEYNKVKVLPCMAIEDLDPVDFKVPLIVFPNGMSPASSSTTAEFLASHGYAVAGFTAMGKDASTINASSQGIDTGVDDIGFVIREVLKLSFVDEAKIGLIGNAIESSFCAAYASKHSKIGALVSLEGGFLSNFEQTLLEKLPYYQPEHLNLPILLLYSPHPSIDPIHIKKLVYSDRYFAHLPGMREFDYLNFGLLDSIVPGIIGEQRGDARQGYTSAHRLILDYFNANFKGDLTPFESSLLELADPAVDTSFVWQSIPSLPPLVTIKDSFIRQGIPYLDSIYSLQKEFIKTPFSKSFITDFTNWVAWKKDPEYRTRQWLMEKAVQDYPLSAKYSSDLAWYSLQLGDSELAKFQFQEALRKLNEDKDYSLTETQKTAIRTEAITELDKMK